MYRDFGVGQMGDMGAHTMDLLWNAIDAGAPTWIEIDQEVSDKYDPDICPVKLKASFEQPANSWRGPVTVVWYQGGLKPDAPKSYIDVDEDRQRRHLRGYQGHHPGRLHHPRDHPQQRRRRLHLLQAPRQGANCCRWSAASGSPRRRQQQRPGRPSAGRGGQRAPACPPV